MKKLMILAAVAMVASFASASAVKWNTNNASYADDSVMMFSAADYATITAYLSDAETGKVATYLSGKALVAENLNTRGAMATPNVIDPVATNPGYFWILFDSTKNGMDVGTAYSMTGVYGATQLADYIYDPDGAATPTTLTLKAAAFTTSGTITAQDVPEPTSAMLLLLGVAGLALKRKRA